MNSLDFFYQIFRMRYSIDTINKSFTERYRLALVGNSQDRSRMRLWLGEFTICSGLDNEGSVVDCDIPQCQEDAEGLRNASLVVCHCGPRRISENTQRNLVDWIPASSAVLFLYEPNEASDNSQLGLASDATLPDIRVLSGNNRQLSFIRMLLSAFPKAAMRLARDFSNLRDYYADRLIVSTCGHLAIIAAASSVTVSIPVVGQLLGLLAVSAETMAITAGQIRLCLLLGGLYGRPLNFFDRMDELWPVVGSAWGWRSLARELVGLVPGAGAVAKAGVAWSGTYLIGQASRKFYQFGEHVSDEVKEQLVEEAQAKALEAIDAWVKGGSVCDHGESVVDDVYHDVDLEIAPQSCALAPSAVEDTQSQAGRAQKPLEVNIAEPKQDCCDDQEVQ